MQLVYLSPVPWSSFAQRPHKFVEWFHACAQGNVLWVDPYPTRFPSLRDYRRLSTKEFAQIQKLPPWLKVLRPYVLPIEPLPASGLINGLMWRSMLKKIETFVRRNPTILVIGKPSVLALVLMRRLDKITSVYDAMDNFPFFYSGLSRLSMSRRERELIRCVTHVLVSSTALKKRWGEMRPDAQIVPNGLDTSFLPTPKTSGLAQKSSILGYVGTIGPWFDWEWVIALAKARPLDVVRLIGPMFCPAPYALPTNIEILPACTHKDALCAMQDFDVGLIPFKNNDLTASVDPIKYYEYRALGLAVISTGFGEMAFRCGEDGIFISMDKQTIGELVHEALLHKSDAATICQFQAKNSWGSRFSAVKIFN
jgi:glycosyltransferase involved in cell wall biosynthesis